MRLLALTIVAVPLVWLGFGALIGWEQVCCGEQWKHLAEDPSYIEIGRQEALQAGYSSDVELPCYQGPIPLHLQLAIAAVFAILPVFVRWTVQDLVQLVRFLRKLSGTIGTKQ